MTGGRDRLLFWESFGDWYRNGNPTGFCGRLVIEALPSRTPFFRSRIHCFFQEQRGGDENNCQRENDEKDRIVDAVNELRDAEPLQNSCFSAPSGGQDGAA